MSVITEADDRLVSAKASVKQAINDLAEIVVKECWGSEDLNKNYREHIKESLNALIEIRNKL